MKDMLLHTCCGPCASAVFPYWTQKGFRIGGLFFNPNIHPFQEWRCRAEGAVQVAEKCGVELLIDGTYDPAAWFAQVRETDERRCLVCIRERLRQTAQQAAKEGYSCFSTTLAVSPYQDHPAIRQAGQQAAELSGVEFVYRDLKNLYNESRRRSREWGIYRQKYCGCLISEWERFRESRTDR